MQYLATHSYTGRKDLKRKRPTKGLNSRDLCEEHRYVHLLAVFRYCHSRLRSSFFETARVFRHTMFTAITNRRKEGEIQLIAEVNEAVITYCMGGSGCGSSKTRTRPRS